MPKSIDLDVGDHVTLTGLDVRVIAAKKLTPDSPSGISFLLKPPLVKGEWTDAHQVKAVRGYSHHEYERDLEEE